MLEISEVPIPYGVTKNQNVNKRSLFEEISTRALQQKRFEDFLSKTLKVRTIRRKKTGNFGFVSNELKPVISVHPNFKQ